MAWRHSPGKPVRPWDCVPAMRLVSTVISLREVPLGETVGYGAAWRAPRDSRIAIVAAGYGDGLLRSLLTAHRY